MNAPLFLTWLLGTLLPLGALWLVYRVALRGERCFGYNQALLLLAPLVAALWPLLPRPEVPLWLTGASVAAGEAGVSVLLPVVQVGQAAAPAAEWAVGPWLLYLSGVALGLGRLVWQAAQLHGIARLLRREVRPGYVLAYTGGRLPTSSFGRVIFWDETAALSPTEAAAVLAHEEAHVRQHHTVGRLWLEVWRAVLWPNPFAHLLLPALRLTHELLADQAAVEAASAGAEATPYPTLLARLAAHRLTGPAYSPLLQPFTFSFTLTRIAMLQNQIPVRRWKQWLVLPVLGGLFLVAGHSASGQTKPVSKALIKPAHSEAQLQTQKETVPAPPTPVLNPAGSEDGAKVYTYVEQMPQLPGGGNAKAIMEAIQSKIVYPTAAGAIPADGRVFARFVVGSDGTVQDATIIKGLTSAFDEAVLAAVRQLPRFTPGQQNGKAVAVSITVPVQFAP